MLELLDSTVKCNDKDILKFTNCERQLLKSYPKAVRVAFQPGGEASKTLSSVAGSNNY